MGIINELKEIFDKAENGTLTYEQFQDACGKANIKLANLTEGGYVSKKKYDDDILTRDTDLKSVRKQLEKANGNEEKLKTLTTDLENLQNKYNSQAYEFAVKDFASTKKFTSKAAKRDFVNSMIAKKLTIENGKIIGAEDFTTAYSEDNQDAFVTENPEQPQPQIVNRTTPLSRAKNEVTKDQFRKMSYSERAKLFKENKSLYDELKE